MAHAQIEIAHHDAVRALRAEYYTDVKSMAEDLISRIKASEIKDEEGLSEAVWEDVDSSQWVIYTFRARQVLFVSDNCDAYFDEGIGDGAELVSTDGLKVEALAFFAMREDLQELLEALNVRNLFDAKETEETTSDAS